MSTTAQTRREKPDTELQESWMSKTPGVCGGDACVRRTRIPVWLLVEERRLGLTDDEILDAHPALSAADLRAAWNHLEHHLEEIEQAVRENQDS